MATRPTGRTAKRVWVYKAARPLKRLDKLAGRLKGAAQLRPLHPGEVLREEFLVPLGISPGTLARTCGVPRTRIERIANEETGITADTALRLARAFGTSPELWLNLQNDFDVQSAKRAIGRQLEKIHPVTRATTAA